MHIFGGMRQLPVGTLEQEIYTVLRNLTHKNETIFLKKIVVSKFHNLAP